VTRGKYSIVYCRSVVDQEISVHRHARTIIAALTWTLHVASQRYCWIRESVPPRQPLAEGRVSVQRTRGRLVADTRVRRSRVLTRNIFFLASTSLRTTNGPSQALFTGLTRERFLLYLFIIFFNPAINGRAAIQRNISNLIQQHVATENVDTIRRWTEWFDIWNPISRRTVASYTPLQTVMVRPQSVQHE
jgi:hypothetical protein